MEGDVIDVSTVNNPLRLEYPTGVYALTTTLNVDGSWDDAGHAGPLQPEAPAAARSGLSPSLSHPPARSETAAAAVRPGPG
jgi:hypothetical protein